MNYNITEEKKHSRNDRIAYIYLMLRNDKTKQFINNKIVELNITSRSTADREISKIEKWNKATKELFLATYIPTESDMEAVESILGVKASKCTKYDTEAAHIINELSAKNEELQKELQKYKNDLITVLDDRQKLECLVSDIANNTVLNPKYDSLYKVLLAAYNQAANGKGKERHQLNDEEPFEKQKLECLLSDNINNTALNPKYDSLYKVLLAAYNQAANGKGKERHQLNDEESFEKQKIC